MDCVLMDPRLARPQSKIQKIEMQNDRQTREFDCFLFSYHYIINN